MLDVQVAKPIRAGSRQVVRASGDDWYGPDRPKFLVSYQHAAALVRFL